MSALQHRQEVCRSVEVGQKAPIDGVFTANDGSKVSYRATRGDVAQSAGRFCVDEPTVALLQRAFSVSDVSDFDVLVQKKKTTTEEGSTEATASTEATVSRKRGKKSRHNSSTGARACDRRTCDRRTGHVDDDDDDDTCDRFTCDRG